MERSHIQRVIDYIETHLKDDLDNTLLAEIAGYSEYHFLRMFYKNVRLTPADYIRKRRISEIVKRIGNSDRKMSDIAFEYGFNSKENFTRAFKKEHKILPMKFKTANCSLRLYQPFEFSPAVPHPEISMAYLEKFVLIVYSCDEKLPSNFWNRYNAEKRSEKLSGGRIVEDFGAMKWNSEKNCLDYYIGIREEQAAGDISGTMRIEIDGGLYAVFDTPPATQHNFVNVIQGTWDWIYDKWLPDSGYRRGSGFEMESYVETSKKYSERIYIPLERK